MEILIKFSIVNIRRIIKFMTTGISDLTYWRLSKQTYKIKQPEVYKINIGDRKEEWKMIKKPSNPETGFDATVYKNRNEIIIAYRGTEGNDPLGRGVKDFKTDVDHVALKEGVFNHNKDNQFLEALDLAAEIKHAYPKANITTTGHSLGGALASFVAAILRLKAVTFSTPSVIDLLPDNIKADAEKGKFDKDIINYIDPRDSIGAGALRAYTRHIGATYMIGSRYEIANADKKNSPFDRFRDTLNIYHSPDRYKFDMNGNLKAAILTNMLTNKELMYSPRYLGEGSEIKINPGELLHHAEELKGRISEVEMTHQEVVVS